MPAVGFGIDCRRLIKGNPFMEALAALPLKEKLPLPLGER
jgi:hypothetical protein